MTKFYDTFAGGIKKMKQFVFYILAFINIGLFAQEVKRRDPSSKLIVGLNNDMWLNAPAGIKPTPISLGANLFYMFDIPLGKGNVGLGWGFGWSSVNLHSNGQVRYTVDTLTNVVSTHFSPYPTNYRVNKLVYNYFDVPLELRFRTPTSSFHVALGVKAGCLINSHTKEIDDAGKRKIYRIENVNLFHYGITFRVGFKRVSFNAFYSLMPLIEKGKGDDKIVPFSIGISTRPF